MTRRVAALAFDAVALTLAALLCLGTQPSAADQDFASRVCTEGIDPGA